MKTYLVLPKENENDSWDSDGKYCYEEGDSIICPWCKCCDWESFYISDYVEKPMIWCNNCPAYAVLDLDLEFSKKDVIPVEKVPFEFNFMNYSCYSDDIKDYDIYEIDLLWIDKVVSQGLDNYKPTHELTQDEIRKFIESSYDKDLAQELSLEIYESDEAEKDVAEKLGINCLSYNIKEPRFPYPDKFDMRHDGIHMHLQCIDKNGKVITVCYWGD